MSVSALTRPAASATSGSEEAVSRERLRGHCFGEGAPYCPRCACDRLYTLADDRWRCAQCKYTFQEHSGRWVNNGGHSCATWINIVSAFATGASAHHTALELELSYNAVYKAFTTLRFAIVAHALDAAQFLGPGAVLSGYLNKGKLTGIPPLGTSKRQQASSPQDIPVYGILNRGERVFVDLVPDLNAETVLYCFIQNFRLGMVRTGNVIHTDRYRHYDALIMCADNSLPMMTHIPTRGVASAGDHQDRSPLSIDRSEGGFWDFARTRLRRYKGLSIHRFPLYLKELEFRYNCRHEAENALTERLLAYVCDLVPAP